MSVLCVMATSRVPPGIRGALNQWMTEVLPGIFVGRPSARVRGSLWAELTAALQPQDAYASMICQADNDQGFCIERVGDHRYEVADFLGVQLVTVKHTRYADGGEEGLPDPSW